MQWGKKLENFNLSWDFLKSYSLRKCNLTLNIQPPLVNDHTNNIICHTIGPIILNLKVVLERAASSKSDVDVGLHPEEASKDALVDVLLQLLRLFRNRVDVLQDGNIVRLPVVEVD